MAHLPYTASRRPAELVVHRPTHINAVRPEVAPRPTLEEQLLVRLDEWMAHHPTAANILAGASIATFIAVTAGAVVVSSI